MKLIQGRKVTSCVLADGTVFAIGKDNITKMSITMEAGKSFFVPWILVICDGKENEPTMLNCATIAAIAITNEDPRQ